MSGNISNNGGKASSQQLDMIGRALMTVDELKSMPKGSFIVMKTGCNPMKSKLPLFLKWGVKFEEAFSVPEMYARTVHYANKETVEKAILKKYQKNQEHHKAEVHEINQQKQIDNTVHDHIQDEASTAVPTKMKNKFKTR